MSSRRHFFLVLLLAPLSVFSTADPLPSSSLVYWSFGNIQAPWRDVVAISAGGRVTAAIQDDGRIASAGRVDWEGLQDSDLVRIRTNGEWAVGLRRNGRVVFNLKGMPTDLQGVADVSIEGRTFPNVTVLDSAGVASVWSSSSGSIVERIDSIRAISSGYDHLLVLRLDGGLEVHGTKDRRLLTIPSLRRKAVGVSAGYWHDAVLLDDGTVAVWGDSSNRQLRVPEGLTGVVALSTGGCHTVALRGDGTAVSWGGTCEYAFACPVSSASSSLPCPPNSDPLVVPADLPPSVAVASGQAHAAALGRDGVVRIWGGRSGRRDFRSLGDVVEVDAFDETVVALRSGGRVSLARNEVNGGFHSWADPTGGRGLDTALAVAAGYLHALVLRADGSVESWMPDGSRDTTFPSGVREVAAIDAGYSTDALVLRDGGVRVWDRAMGAWWPLVDSQDAAQGSIPRGLPPAQGVAIASDQVALRMRDGSAISWGFEDPLPAPLWNGRRMASLEGGRSHFQGVDSQGVVHQVRAWEAGIPVWSSLGAFPPATDTLPPIRFVVAGQYGGVLLDREGGVHPWGVASFGAQATTRTLPPARRVAQGIGNAYALLETESTVRVVRGPRSTSAALEPGRYEVSIHGLDGIRLGSGVASWDGSVWNDLPCAARGLAFLRVATPAGRRTFRLGRIR